ncbi:MAG: ArnT family glycosyltransferase [Chthoniobacterales bacterium]
MTRAGGIVDRLLAAAAAGLLAYWAVYVAVAPVVNGDAHGYNLGRLLVAERHGLFDNAFWTNVNQIVFPWAFDAVHYPFLKIGLFENLPSFLCFLGLLCAVVLMLRRCGAPGLWPTAVLALLASPMIALQATTAKNDFALLFFAVAGAWFLVQWIEGDRRAFIPIMAALCAAFAVGTKTTGVIFAMGISAGALVAAFRNGWHRGWIYFAAFPVFLLLFGSIETVWNNHLSFGDWQGDTVFMQWHQHSDGLKGALANAIRYFFNGLTSGLDANFVNSSESFWLKHRCVEVLQLLGIQNYGLRQYDSPESFYLLVANVDSQTTFGLVGLLGAGASLVLLARLRFRTVWWWLALTGWAYFGAFCLKVGWGPTNLRMLTPAYGLWIISATIALAPWLRDHAGWRRGLTAAFLLMALAVPMFASKRSPQAIAEALHDRDAMMLAERPSLREELALADRVRRENPDLPAFVVLGFNGWVVPYLQGAHGKWEPVPNPNDLKQLDIAGLRKLYPALQPGREILLILSQNTKLDIIGKSQVLGTTTDGVRALRVTIPPDSATPPAS